MLFILSILFGVSNDYHNEEIYDKNQTSIMSVLERTRKSASLLGKDCHYEYGWYWDNNYVAIDWYCYVGGIWYNVLMAMKHSKGTDSEWYSQFDWRRIWVNSFLANK